MKLLIGVAAGAVLAYAIAIVAVTNWLEIDWRIADDVYR